MWIVKSAVEHSCRTCYLIHRGCFFAFVPSRIHVSSFIAALKRQHSSRQNIRYFVSDAPDARVFVLKEGDALFIPAGWFHEVSSWPSDCSESATQGACGDAGLSASSASERSCESAPDSTPCSKEASASAAEGESRERHSRAYSNNGRHNDHGVEKQGFHAAINFWFKPPSTTT